MTVAYVDGWDNDTNGTGTSLTVTVGTDATAGNLLVAGFGLRRASSTIATPAGWTKRIHIPFWGCYQQFWVFTRTATGTTDDNLVLSWAATVSAAAWVQEFSGSQTPDISAWDHGDERGWTPQATFSTTEVCPTVPLPSGISGGMVMSVVGFTDQDEWTNGLEPGAGHVTIPSGFSNVTWGQSNSSNGFATAVCSKTFTGTSDQSGGTWSTDQSLVDGSQLGLTILLSDEDEWIWPVINRYWGAGTQTAVTSNTVSLSSAATAGNLLIGSIALRNWGTSGAFVTPSGWNLIYATDSIAFQSGEGAWYYRTATGDANDDFAGSWGQTAEYSMIVVEVENVTTQTPTDKDEDTTYQSSVTSSMPTGTVTPTAARSFCIAMTTGDRSNEWSGAIRLQQLNTNGDGWHKLSCYNNNVNTNTFTALMYKVVDGTDNQTTNVDGNLSGSEGWGSIIVFDLVAGGLNIVDVDGNTYETGTGTVGYGAIINDGRSVVVELSGAVSATGKRVFIEQDGDMVEQTVTGQDATSVTFTLDYGVDLERGDATLHVWSPTS